MKMRALFRFGSVGQYLRQQDAVWSLDVARVRSRDTWNFRTLCNERTARSRESESIFAGALGFIECAVGGCEKIDHIIGVVGKQCGPERTAKMLLS
jgi:hypothetical protein